LSIWIFDLHQPEAAFWHAMSPRRFLALLEARTQPKKVSKSDTQQQSLFAYLSGGG
jgi:hypothetical protein